MSDYAPLYMPGDAITGTTSAEVTGGQTLIVSGNGTVGPATAASDAVVGVAAHAAASGALVTYHGRGQVHVTTASGGITAGARVDAGAAGTVASGSAGVHNIGIALTTAVDTALCTWMEL
jgi:hypothetical protein